MTQLPDVLVWLLPLFFVLHEAEEILFLPAWLHNHREEVMRRFPRLYRLLFSRLDGISRGAFAGIAAEEFLWIAGAASCATFARLYYPWLALFLAFGLHLVIHFLQAAAVGRILPVVASSLAGLLYCGWGLQILCESRLFDVRDYLLCAAAGSLFAGMNLFLIHPLASKIRRRSAP